MQKWVFGCVSLSFRHLHAYIYVTVCICIKYLRAFFMARSGARIVFAQLGENNAFVFTRTPPQMHTHTHTKKKITHTSGGTNIDTSCVHTHTDTPSHGTSSHSCIGILAKENQPKLFHSFRFENRRCKLALKPGFYKLHVRI